MKRSQISTSVSDMTRRQAEWLVEHRGFTFRDIVTLGINHLYQQEHNTMITQIWKHQSSGGLYAVSFPRYESLVSEASDDIRSDEVETVLLDGYDSHPEQAGWINEHSDEFELYAYVHDGKVVLN